MMAREPLTIRIEQLELDIELRLGTTLLDALACVDANPALVLSYLRYAYGTGYSDALIDQPRGKLFRDHGFSVPKRKPR
jgi:hypothetical protein